MSSVDQIEEFAKKGLTKSQISKLIDKDYRPYFLKTRTARRLGFTKKKNMAYRRSYRRRRYTPRRSVRKTRRRTYRRRRSAPVGPQSLTGTAHGDKYVKAMADPFDESVDGVKIPDSNSQPSVALKCDDTWDFTIGATESSQCVAFNPSFGQQTVTATFVSSTTWSWPAAFGGSANASKLTQIRADQEMYRPVAHGVRITSALAPTAAVGFLHVCVYSQALAFQSTWTYPTSISQMQNTPGYKRIPIGRLTSEGITIVNRPLDVTAQRYVDTDANPYGNAAQMEFHSGLQWCSIVVAVSGVTPSTVPISVEQILHLECIPRSTSIGQATPAAKLNLFAQGGAGNANSKVNPVMLDSEKSQRAARVVQETLTGGQAATGNTGGGMLSRSALARLLGGLRRSDMSMRTASDGIRNTAPSHSGMFL